MALPLRPGWAAPRADRAVSGAPLATRLVSRPARMRLTMSVMRVELTRSRARVRAASKQVGATSVACMLAEASRINARWRGASLGVAGLARATAANVAA